MSIANYKISFEMASNPAGTLPPLRPGLDYFPDDYCTFF